MTASTQAHPSDDRLLHGDQEDARPDQATCQLVWDAIVCRGATDSYLEGTADKTWTSKGTLDPDLLRRHCDGSGNRIGAVPFSSESEVGWACIDLDVLNWGIDPEDPEALALVTWLVQLLREQGIRPYAERSRGKGWHVWVVFSRPVNAGLVRRVLRQAAIDCGARDESDLVCPRQDNRGAVGNGTWLPLYGGDREPFTRFYEIDENDDLVVARDQSAVLQQMIDDPTPSEALQALAETIDLAPTEAQAQDESVPADDWGDCDWIGTELYEHKIELQGARYVPGANGRPGKILFGCPFHETEKMRAAGGSAVLYADGGGGGCASSKCEAQWPNFRSFVQRLTGGDSAAQTAKVARLIKASDVQPEPIRWLWQPYIPAGKMTLLEGEGGVGKTTVMCDLMARITTGNQLAPDGAHPFGDGKPRSVIFASAEDDLADTLRPRVEAAGADLDRVLFWTDTTEANGEPRDPEVPADLDVLETVMREHDVALVFFDPIFSFLGDVKTSNDKEVRQALRPVRNLCERTGVAVVSVRHWNKRVDLGAAMRGGDSVAFTNASRSVIACTPHPDDDEADEGPSRFLVFIGKSNLAPRKTPPVAYTIEPATVAADIHTTRVSWLGVDLEADLDALKHGAGKPGPPPEKKTRAEEWVRDLMSDDKARTLEMIDEALQADSRADFSLRTVQRVLKDLVEAEQLRRYVGLRSKAWWTALMEEDAAGEELES